MNENLRKKAIKVLLIVLVIAGGWRLGVAILSQVDDGLMWFDRQGELWEARQALEDPLAKMYGLCEDISAHEKLELDDHTRNQLHTLCSRMERASTTGNVHHLLQYWAFHKPFFEPLMRRMMSQPVEVARLAMEMRLTECDLMAPVETISSISASARVSDFLLGLVLFLLGGISLWRRRRRESA